MVNMGENMARDNMREIRKMRKEIVDPRLDSKQLDVQDLLPKVALTAANSAEESKQTGAHHDLTANKRTAKERYADLDDSEEINIGSGVLPDSQIQSAR